jgi:mRNA interferase HigB
MKLFGKPALSNFKKKQTDAQSQIESWEAEVQEADWKTPHDLKQRYPKASILGNQNVIFNLCRNSYRLWVKVDYRNRVVLVKKIGTHKEYDKWRIN